MGEVVISRQLSVNFGLIPKVGALRSSAWNKLLAPKLQWFENHARQFKLFTSGWYDSENRQRVPTGQPFGPNSQAKSQSKLKLTVIYLCDKNILSRV